MDHQAFAQMLGNYGEFLGAIAVFGTLAYLAVQVRQSKTALDANTRVLDESSKLNRTDTVRQLTRNWDEILRRVSENQEIAEIFVTGNKDLRELDEVDQFIYSMQLVPFLTHHVAAHQMYEDGFLGEEYIELLDKLIGDLIRQNPGARTWWDAIGWSYPHNDYVNQLVELGEVEDRWSIGAPLVPKGSAR